MKKLIVASLLLFTVGSVKAQKLALIPKAGINISTQAIEGLGNEKGKVGFQGGLGLNIQTGDNFSIQPEINYVSKGTKLEFGNTKTSLDLNYLEVPILAKYAFGPVYVNAGPSIGLSVDKKSTVARNYGDELKKIDFGVQMGAGLALPLGKGKVIIDGRYALGLNNIAKNGNEIKNRGILTSLGYMIPF
ncbi:MAG: PorT family protein [Flavobacterium sp.]|nr:MAG: PorT family protein [Flavobacterium sp.]